MQYINHRFIMDMMFVCRRNRKQNVLNGRILRPKFVSNGRILRPNFVPNGRILLFGGDDNYSFYPQVDTRVYIMPSLRDFDAQITRPHILSQVYTCACSMTSLRDWFSPEGTPQHIKSPTSICETFNI